MSAAKEDAHAAVAGDEPARARIYSHKKKKTKQGKTPEERAAEEEEQRRLAEEEAERKRQEEEAAREAELAEMDWEDYDEALEDSQPTKAAGAAGGAGGDDDWEALDGDDDGQAGEGARPAKPAPRVEKTLEERIEDSREAFRARYKDAKAARDKSRLRSPICVVLGHVDTGKTKLLDCIRRTNVQGGEAGGITQQIGATYFPMKRLAKQTDKLNAKLKLEYRVPGLLVIDTPGHESFTNLRSRGTNLCDIAILVVDIMHGLEPQTLESLRLLTDSKTPFIVALNKIDRTYDWKSTPNNPVRKSLEGQASHTLEEFERRARDIIVEFAEQGLDAALYYENDDYKRKVSLVPTSAMTGEGVPDLLMLLVQLTQTLMTKQLMYLDFPQATVLEVKQVSGLGTTIDIILLNGELKQGDTIVVCGMNGPIVTQVRALLTPPPAREIRVKADYVHHERLIGAMGIKIAAPGLQNAVAGTKMFVLHPQDEVEHLKLDVQEDLEKIMAGLATDGHGVMVQASTLGAMEALLEYLRSCSIPVAGINLGPVHRKHVMEASTALEKKKREFGAILAFDVPVTPEARALADESGVRVFTADIIYHLSDEYEAFTKQLKEEAQAAASEEAVWPVIAQIRNDAVFNRGGNGPIIVGMDVEEGKLRLGQPLCCVVGEAPDGGPLVLPLGRVTSIEHNHTQQEVADAGGPAVAVRIERTNGPVVLYGRNFDHRNKIYAHISRRSIDLLKANFRDDVSKPEWRCLIQLKKLLGVDRVDRMAGGGAAAGGGGGGR